MILTKNNQTSLVGAILHTYGVDDLAEYSNFQGGYINFGYWKAIPHQDLDIIPINQRVQSSENLYDLVLTHANIKPNDHVAEIGCGRGLGCARVLLNYGVNKIIGFDISKDQIARALNAQKHLCTDNRLQFITSAVESISYDTESFDKVFAVESAQHFVSMKQAATELFRVLKSNGTVTLAAHFSTSEVGRQNMEKHDWIMKEGIDNLIPIDTVIHHFKCAGFRNIILEKIGVDVFPGYEKWLIQNKDSKPWARNLFKSYKAGYLDYYLVQFQKSL